jgi:hypothetical protein
VLLYKHLAEVHHIRHRAIILLDDDGNELILPKEKQAIISHINLLELANA